MKKLLILLTIIGLFINDIAGQDKKLLGMTYQGRIEENGVLSENDNSSDTSINEMGSDNPNPRYPKSSLKNKNHNEAINSIEIGISANQRSFRREETHVISYNPELDIISTTFLLDPATYAGVNEVGVIGQFYSTDKGATWNGPVILANNSGDGSQNTFPSGIVYNPTGNTTVSNAVGITQSTNNNWNEKVFGSSTLGGANYQTYIYENSVPNMTLDGYWNQIGLNQYGSEVRCMNLVPEGGWAAFSSASLQPIYGSFNGSTFNWDISQTIDMNLAVNSDNIIEWIGKWNDHDAGLEMVWSNDGQIGYVWMLAVSATTATSYQPIMFKTTDAGSNWSSVSLDFTTNEMQTYLSSYLIPTTNNNTYIPYFYESVGSVDYNGDLQLFAAVYSSYDDVISHPESLWNHYDNTGDLFNITVDGNGVKDMKWIETLHTKIVVAGSDESYNGTGWLHRLSASKNDSEQQVFLTWVDTQDNVNNEFNISPDIYGWSKSCLPNGAIIPSIVCFTDGAINEGQYYFTYGAERAYLNNNGNYSIPYLQAITPVEFANNTSASADPVTASYISGIEFPPLGINPFSWVGTTNNDWHTASNWSGGVVPTSASDVIIPTGMSNYPTISSSAVCKDLTIKSDATGASLIGQENLTASGTISSERYISGYSESLNGWHFLSSPMSSQTIAGSDFVPSPEVDDLFEWGEINGEWLNYNGGSFSDTEFEVGKGYLVSYASNGNKEFSGSFNTSNITRNLSYTAGQGEGWNLLGNPYPSAIDWELITKSGDIDASIYVVDRLYGTYLVWNGSAGDISNGEIPVNQGFFVKANSAGQSVTMELADQKHSNNDFNKSSDETPQNSLKISLRGESSNNNTYIQFREDANQGFDSHADAYKLFGFAEIAQVYTHMGEEDYAINCLNYTPEPISIPLGIYLNAEEDLTLEFNEIESFDGTVKIELEDKRTGGFIDLRAQANYSFSGALNDEDNRFLLHFSNVTGVEEQENLDIQVYEAGQAIYIQNPNNIQADLFVYNVNGQLLYSAKTSGNSLQKIEESFAKGVYLVSIESNRQKQTEKIIIQ